LKNYNFSSKFIIANALYSTVKFAKFVLNKKLISIIPTKDTLQQRLKINSGKF
jgi:hypothetical protein